MVNKSTHTTANNKNKQERVEINEEQLVEANKKEFQEMSARYKQQLKAAREEYQREKSDLHEEFETSLALSDKASLIKGLSDNHKQ